VTFHRPRHLSRDELQGVERQPLPRLAISTRGNRLGRAQVAPAPPHFDPPRHFPARTARTQRLRHEGPKRDRGGQTPPTAVDSLCARFEQLQFEEMPEDRVKVFQAFEPLQTFED